MANVFKPYYATESSLGGLTLKAGQFIVTTDVGNIYLDTSSSQRILIANKYNLPVATTSALGGVKSGSAIQVDANGNVTVVSNGHTHTIAQLSDLNVTADEINFLAGVTSNVQTQLDGKVPTTRTVNGKALSSDISLTASDVSAVPTTRKINNKALSEDITLTSGDVGALSSGLKGAANGVASLDGNGKVPSSQLPSFVDDVIEGTLSGDTFTPAEGAAGFTPETGKIYIDTNTNKTYRWSGTGYAEISESLALGTTSSTAFAGDKGNTLYTNYGPSVTTGSTNKPVYISNGAPTEIGYTINTSVPSDAVFTDTHYQASLIKSSSATGTTNTTSGTNPRLNLVENGTVRNSIQISGSGGTTVNNTANGLTISSPSYSNATTSTDGLMSAADKTKLDELSSSGDAATPGDNLPIQSVAGEGGEAGTSTNYSRADHKHPAQSSAQFLVKETGCTYTATSSSNTLSLIGQSYLGNGQWQLTFYSTQVSQYYFGSSPTVYASADANGTLQVTLDRNNETTFDVQRYKVGSIGTLTLGSGSNIQLLNSDDNKITYFSHGMPIASDASIGATNKPVYINNGIPTASTSTIGSTTKPIYMSRGTLTASSSTVGSTKKPVYLSSGTITASTSTIGSTTTPIYMNSGTLTSCGDFYITAGKKSGTTLGTRATAEGYDTTSSGLHSHAEGWETTASGSYTHAEGIETVAHNDADHAEGGGSQASGGMSHAEGFLTVASGAGSHSEGYQTVASGISSHAEGGASRANGDCSHAEGVGSQANGEGSHAGGICTIADGEAQTAIGLYNISDTNSLFIVGNGTDTTDRSNALKLDSSGNLEIAGSINASAILDVVYPVGSIYMSTNNTSPATRFGGTWTQIKDKFLLAAGDTYTAGSTGGTATNQLRALIGAINGRTDYIGYQAVDAVPGQSYYFGLTSSGIAISSENHSTMVTDSAGNTNINNLPPYEVVYMWKRTA